jgi:hypothetical protein
MDSPTTPPSLPELEREAAWASRSLCHCENRDPNTLTIALLTTLDELRQADIPHRAEHPSARLLIAELAELAGLNFQWPTDAEQQCRFAVTRFRAESSCIAIPKAA